MAYVISQLCIECVDAGCVEACPVDCIFQPVKGSASAFPHMLFIHPTQCINCGACEPECPWEAIYEEFELPDKLRAALELNALPLEQPSRFEIARRPRDAQGRLIHKPQPAPEQVAANRRRWEDHT